MKLISKNVHNRLLRAADRAERKFADKMLTAKVPVNARILKELKLPVPPEAEEKLAESDAKPTPRGVSHAVACMVRLSDYLTALRAYEPNDPSKKKDSK